MNEYRAKNPSLDNLSKEELISKIKALEAHNTQLRNIIAKGDSKDGSNNSKKVRGSFNFTNCKFRHVLLKFFYLGWDYHGYCVQEDNPNTIENQLFSCLQITCLIKDRASSNYHRCGRTDKGVSSFSQVISIDLRSKSDDVSAELNYCKMLNRVLPKEIQCVAWCPVPSSFSARFDCKSRTYKYFFPSCGLDLDKMRTAANYLIGCRDFRNFCKMDVGNGVVEFTRNVTEISITPLDHHQDANYAIHVLTIKGKAFLWHQIRCVMGVLLLVAQNKEEPEVVKEMLNVEANPRRPSYHLGSEIPLNLFNCDYEQKDVEWIYDEEAFRIALRNLWEIWTFTQIKASMMETMISNLNSVFSDLDVAPFSPSEVLVQGVKSKIYTPLMKRQLCDSLEDKVEHYKKKQKCKNDVQSQ